MKGHDTIAFVALSSLLFSTYQHDRNFRSCDALSPSIPSWKSPSSLQSRTHFRFIHQSTVNSIASKNNIISDETSPHKSTLFPAQLDHPLLTSFVLRSVRHKIDADEPDGESNNEVSHFTVKDASKALFGLQIWEETLRKERLPQREDFLANSQELWPEEPLFSHLYSALSLLGLPRLVSRHPEIFSSVLLGVAKIVVKFIDMLRQGKMVIIEENDSQGDDWGYDFSEDDSNIDDINAERYEYIPLTTAEIEHLAESLGEELSQEWGGVIKGVTLLDKVFGYGHNLLDWKGTSGFSLHDGVWKHNGWTSIPELQKMLSSMPELRTLLSYFGRRPSADGSKMSRFHPRKRSYSHDDMMGVEIDPLNPSSVSGLTHSDSVTSMLPSEAILLRSSFKVMRWLFLAKKAESKLLSYELAGWTDVNTRPLPQTRRLFAMPFAAGGHLMICLDTSWSMTGWREKLAKAVVLASVSAAHAQRRECRIISFSSGTNVMESGVITCDTDGVRQLLHFLSFSFGGGTDVTGALTYAIDNFEDYMASSDLLLVTDGELPDPPVSDEMMTKLKRLRQQTGMEIHGLLIGKRESLPLTSICTKVHNFLMDYEQLDAIHRDRFGFGSIRSQSSLAALSLRSTETMTFVSQARSRIFMSRKSFSNSNNFSKIRGSVSLFANRDIYGEELLEPNTKLRLYRKDDRNGKRRRHISEDDDSDYQWNEDSENKISKYISSTKREKSDSTLNDETNYVQRVGKTFNLLKNTVSVLIAEKAWSPNELELELKQSSLWNRRKVLIDSISHVQEGLVERDMEAKLLVLGIVSHEHVLFIGPPGTSKSELGRRLSQLCGGSFFQRLFTRFTTPEEIFGPLSLRALENDEYIRCIDGFLPTSTVAFLDEIFKANSAILNTLLTILNERQFDNGAGKRVECPLKCAIGASNELPESEELDALLDRFLLRVHVLPVSDSGLLKILAETSSVPNLCANYVADDLEKFVSDVSESLNVTSIDPDICVLIRDLRAFARDEMGLYISDRRLVKASKLLRICAATHGRSKVDYVDCLLLQHILWRVPEQRELIREWLLDNLTPGVRDQVVEQSRFLLSGLVTEALSMVKITMGDVTGELGARKEDLDTIRSILKEIEAVETLLQTQSDILDRHTALLDILPSHLWLGHDEAHGTRQYLLPLANAASSAVKGLLEETVTLKQSLLPKHVENELRSSVIEMLMRDMDNNSLSEGNMQLHAKRAGGKLNKSKPLKQKSHHLVP